MSNKSSKPASVADYLAGLPDERRAALEALRATILKNLDPAIQEGIQYGMIGYSIPHSVYPQGYHCDPRQPLPFASIASQKNHIGIYLFCLYQDPDLKAWFTQEWTNTGKRLDMGASCIRVKKLEDVPLALLGNAIRKISAKKFIRQYESQFGDRHPANKSAAKKPAAKKQAKKVAKKVTKKVTKQVTKKVAKPASKKSAAKKTPTTTTKKPAAARKAPARKASATRQARSK
ncbi:MAG: DUF1801 domain-containing protein [Phycisphaerales bacterium JB037]